MDQKPVNEAETQVIELSELSLGYSNNSLPRLLRILPRDMWGLKAPMSFGGEIIAGVRRTIRP